MSDPHPPEIRHSEARYGRAASPKQARKVLESGQCDQNEIRYVEVREHFSARLALPWGRQSGKTC